jgi:hypothetical protein
VIAPARQFGLSARLDPPGFPDLYRDPFQLGRDRLPQRRCQPLDQHQDTRLAGALSLRRADDPSQRHQSRGVTLEDLGDSGHSLVLLASEKLRFTTGDILTVDGGLPEAFPR